MEQISNRVKQWIKEQKDPRSAHWQGGLEQLLDVFSPYMESGKMIPVQALEDDDFPVFLTALEAVDLSPNLQAAFLPPSIAGSVNPPESAEELFRIDKGKPSYKILIARPGKELRILCAEISAHANTPGVDIFQEGSLLGTYDYDTSEACLADLTKVIRVHIWEKGPWQPDDHKRYTIHWFEKIMDLGKGTVKVQKDFSFLHSPTLIKSNSVDVIFTLIFDILQNRLNDSDDPLKDAILSIRQIENKDDRTDRFNQLAESQTLELLNLIKEFEIINFGEFSDAQNEQFKTEFFRTIHRLSEVFEG